MAKTDKDAAASTVTWTVARIKNVLFATSSDGYEVEIINDRGGSSSFKGKYAKIITNLEIPNRSKRIQKLIGVGLKGKADAAARADERKKKYNKSHSAQKEGACLSAYNECEAILKEHGFDSSWLSKELLSQIQ